MKYLIVYICFSLMSSISGYSQEVDQDFIQDDIVSALPSLQTIIDSTLSNNPMIRIKDLEITANEFKLRSEKSNWTRTLGFQSDVRYGTFNNFSTNVAEGQSPTIIATNVSQMNYGIGFYIKLPFHDVINRKNQIGQAKAELEQAYLLAEAQRQEVRKIVIQQYNEVILKHRLFVNKSRSIETARISLKMVEEEFKNGVIPVTEYARTNQVVSVAEDEMERSKMEFINAVMILEEIAGYSFNLFRNQ